MLLVTAQALLVIIQQKPGGTAQTEQPKPGSEHLTPNPKALENPARSFPSASHSNRNICAVCQSTGPHLCFESKQGSPSTPRFALTHPNHDTGSWNIPGKTSFCPRKAKSKQTKSFPEDTLLPLPSDRGQLALPNTFAALNQGQILNKSTKTVSHGTTRMCGEALGPIRKQGLMDQCTPVLHPHLILWCLQIQGHH